MTMTTAHPLDDALTIALAAAERASAAEQEALEATIEALHIARAYAAQSAYDGGVNTEALLRDAAALLLAKRVATTARDSANTVEEALLSVYRRREARKA